MVAQLMKNIMVAKALLKGEYTLMVANENRQRQLIVYPSTTSKKQLKELAVMFFNKVYNL